MNHRTLMIVALVLIGISVVSGDLLTPTGISREVGTGSTPIDADYIEYSGNGIYLYAVDLSANTVNQITLFTSYDPSSITTLTQYSYTGDSDLYWTNDGESHIQFRESDDSIWQRVKSSNFYSFGGTVAADHFTSIGSQYTTVTGLDMSTDGTKLFASNQAQDNMKVWDMSTPFLTTTIAFNTTWSYPSSYSISSFSWDRDGEFLFLLDSASGTLYIYEADNYDISTLTLFGTDTLPELTSPVDVEASRTNEIITILDHADNTVYTYDFVGYRSDPVTLTAVNSVDGSSINTFNALIDGVFYGTTNGTIVTHVTKNDATLYDITFYASGYLSNTSTDVDVTSGSYEGSIAQTVVYFECVEVITSDSVTCTDDGSPQYQNAGTYTESINATGYFNQAYEYTIAGGANQTYSVEFYDFSATVEVEDYTTASVEDFDITINNTALGYTDTDLAVNGSLTYQLLMGYSYDLLATTDDSTGSLSFTNTTTSATETSTTTLTLSTIPVINSISIVEEATQIEGFTNVTDVDGDNLTIEYEWFKNDVSFSEGSILVAGTGTYNVDNVSIDNYTTLDVFILSIRVTDGTTTTDWTNSTGYAISDVSPPVLENATQPGSVEQNSAGTFTVQVSDDGVVDSVYVSFKDPNDITIGNLSMSLSSGNTYTRSYTFTTIGNYTSVVFSAVDGNGNADTLEGLGFVVTEAVPSGGGGGGGGSTIEVPNEVSGTLDAQPVEVYVGPFNSGGELIITNEESAAKTFTVRLVSTDLPDRISFAGSESATLTVEGQGSLSGNKKFLSYTVDREELPEGEYTATFELVDEVGRVVDSVTVTIISRSSPLSGLISGFGTPIFGTVTAGTLVALIAFATIAGVLIFRTPRAKATSSRRKT